MKPDLNSRGFAVSPFFMVSLIILGAIIAVHFTNIDNTKAKSIAREARLNNAILDVEETKHLFQSIALFSAYQAAHDAGQRGISDEQELKDFLIREVRNDMNSYKFDGVRSSFSGSRKMYLSGKFVIDIDDSDRDNGFIVYTPKTGTKKISLEGDVAMSSTLPVYKFVGTRIFLLRDIADDNVKGKFKNYLAGIMKEKLEKRLGVNCQIRQGSHDIDIYCERIGAPSSNPPINDGNYAARFFEDSVVDLERGVMNSKYFRDVTDKQCVIKFKPKKFAVGITKRIV